jgi:hypothetical protein
MSHLVSKRNTHPVLRNLIGTGLVCLALVAVLSTVLVLPGVVLRLVLWASH